MYNIVSEEYMIPEMSSRQPEGFFKYILENYYVCLEKYKNLQLFLITDYVLLHSNINWKTIHSRRIFEHESTLTHFKYLLKILNRNQTNYGLHFEITCWFFCAFKSVCVVFLFSIKSSLFACNLFGSKLQISLWKT